VTVLANGIHEFNEIDISVVVQSAIPESRTATLGRLLSGRNARLTVNRTTTDISPDRSIHFEHPLKKIRRA